MCKFNPTLLCIVTLQMNEWISPSYSEKVEIIEHSSNTEEALQRLMLDTNVCHWFYA